MQPELVSLMQQLVTAVQSIALSVDVISVDLRALNKNVAQLVKKDSDKESSGLLLAPECSYTQNDDASSQVLPGSTADQMSVLEGNSSYHSPDIPEEAEPQEKYTGIRDTLREDIKKAMERSGGMDVAQWQEDCTREAMQNSPWEEHLQLSVDKDEKDVLTNKMDARPPGGEASGLASDPRSMTQASGMSPEVRSLTQSDGVSPEGRTLMQASGIPSDGRSLTHASGMTADGRSLTHASGVSVDGRSLPQIPSKKGGLFKCVWCGREFSDSYKLKRHWRVHTGERPFQCALCGKSFAHKENLMVHKRVHTGERPFSCEICGKAFRQKDYLIVHRRVHTGERPFSCETCGKAFKDSGKLTRHKRLHLAGRRVSLGMSPL